MVEIYICLFIYISLNVYRNLWCVIIFSHIYYSLFWIATANYPYFWFSYKHQCSLAIRKKSISTLPIVSLTCIILFIVKCRAVLFRFAPETNGREVGNLHFVTWLSLLNFILNQQGSEARSQHWFLVTLNVSLD